MFGMHGQGKSTLTAALLNNGLVKNGLNARNIIISEGTTGIQGGHQKVVLIRILQE